MSCTFKCVRGSKRQCDFISAERPYCFRKSAPMIALETSAIIKTHLNVCQSPTCKSNVNKQVPYEGIKVLLMACRWDLCIGFTDVCANVVAHWLPHPCRYEIHVGDFVYGQQRSLSLAAGPIVSLFGALRCAFPSRIFEMSVVPTYPRVHWRMWSGSGSPVASAVASAPPSGL